MYTVINKCSILTLKNISPTGQLLTNLKNVCLLNHNQFKLMLPSSYTLQWKRDKCTWIIANMYDTLWILYGKVY